METQVRFEYGAVVALHLVVPDEPEVMLLDGIVRWFDARGFGLQFLPMGARETHALAVLIEQARAAPKAQLR